MIRVQTQNSQQTQKLAEIFAKKIKNISLLKSAFVIGLEGNLGSGKTTFVQGFAKGLGIKEKIKSPSFAIMKIFELGHKKNKSFNHLIHLDAYRLNKPEEILDLGFEEIIKNPKNLVLIEWFEKIKKILEKPHIKIAFKILKK